MRGIFVNAKRGLVLAAALAAAAAMADGTAAHAATVAASSAPCTLNPATSCQSTNGTLALNIQYTTASACTFDWHVDWGDGNVSDVTVTDPPDGYVRLAQHTYTKANAYTISATGQVTAGTCTASPENGFFTLLKPPPTTGPIASSLSTNWSGYTGVAKGVSEVHATWQVPTVTCGGSSKSSAVSIWTGIDDAATHLVQAGMQADCASSKAKPVYYTWWESLPATETPVAKVSAGNQVTVDIKYHVGPTTYFAVQLAVNGSVQFTRNVTVKNEPLNEAECIVEAPTRTRTILGIKSSNPTQLAKFNPVTFTDCGITTASAVGQQIGRGSMNGVTVTRDTMADLRRPKDAVGAPGTGGAPWTVTWKNPD